MADQVLYSGVACITDLMVKEGLINLDFADVRAVMREMGKAMMGTGESSGDKRALQAAEAAIANPLLDETSMKGARGLLISISGGNDMTLYEVDEAATRIREEVDHEANIIVGATFDQALEGVVRVSVVATGIDQIANVIAETEAVLPQTAVQRISVATERLRQEVRSTVAEPAPVFAPAAQSHHAVEAELPLAAAMPEAVAGLALRRAAAGGYAPRGRNDGSLHSASARAAGRAGPAHAARRGFAAAGAKPASRREGPRSSGAAGRGEAHDAAAAPRGRRPRPARGRA